MDYYVFGAILLVIVLFLVVIFFSFYEKCPPFCMIVIYNKIGDNYTIAKIKKGAGTFYIPFIQGGLVLPADSISKSLTLYNIKTNDKGLVTISILYTYIFSQKTDIFQNAIDKLKGYSMDMISNRISVIVQNGVIDSISKLKYTEAFSVKTFIQTLKSNLRIQLKDIGIELQDLIIENVVEGSR